MSSSRIPMSHREASGRGSRDRNRPFRGPAEAGVGPHSRAAGPRARGTSHLRRRALRPAGGRVGEGRRRGAHARELAQVAFKKHVRMARLEGGALGAGGGHVGRRWSRCCGSGTTSSSWRRCMATCSPMRPGRASGARASGDTAERRALDGVGKRMAQAMAEQVLLSNRRTDALHLRLVKYIAKRSRAATRAGSSCSSARLSGRSRTAA